MGNDSVLARVAAKLQFDEVGSKYPTYVAIAETPGQQVADKRVIERLDKKVKVEVMSVAQAEAKGYKCGDGPFTDLLLFHRHVDPESKSYYPFGKWRKWMATLEARELESLFCNMGARTISTVKDSSRTVTASSESRARVDLSAGIISTLSTELGLKASTSQSVAAHLTQTNSWNAPSVPLTAGPETYFVKHATVLGEGLASTTPWDLAVRFRDAERATTPAVVYVSSMRSSTAQSKSRIASLKVGLKKTIAAGLGGDYSSDETVDTDVVTVYVITFWQKEDYKIKTGSKWLPVEVMPDGDNRTAAVRVALEALVEKRQETYQGAALAVKRISQSLSKRVSGAFASMTLSTSVRVGFAGPVGAGKTSLATSLAITLKRRVPCLSEEINVMYDTYRVRREGVERQNDGTSKTPYVERVVFGDDGECQLVLCDMPGMKDAGRDADEFAGHLADDQRNTLQKKADEVTGRGAPTPDVVFLVFDGDELSSMTDEKAERLLEPYAVFMATVREALKKPRLPFLVVVTKMDKVDHAETATKIVMTRLRAALAGDLPDVLFVHNYTKKELDGFSEVIENASTAKAHEMAEATKKYNSMISSCRVRSSKLVDVVLCALNAVDKADSS
jgi:GTPase SAR1 family protein